MTTRKAYQTLEDRGNPEEIESKGPFLCNRPKAWLGEGYYFWDSFINNAHWWGKKGACYVRGYIICESSYELNEKCFDLHDNPQHMSYFENVIRLMTKQRLYQKDKTTVARIIEFVKQNTSFSEAYEAIRVNGTNSVALKSHFSSKIPFKSGKNYQYLDISPAIQICFFNKSSLNRKDFKIVYPPEYSEEYVV